MSLKDDMFYRKLLDAINDGVYFVDLDRRITYWNRAAERITGYMAAEVTGKACSDNILRHIDTAACELCTGACPLAKTLEDGQEREVPVFLHHKDGHRVPVTIRAAVLTDEKGVTTGAVEVFSDQRPAHETLAEVERLRKEVLADPLTGVGNRRFGDLILTRHLGEARSQKLPLGVLFADIDHFKKVNDIQGHSAGDAALKSIASTISGNIRSMDEVCRWGGEEFLVILPGIDRATLVDIANRLRMLVESTWLDFGDERIRTTISIGAALLSREESPESLVARADAAMYQAKAAGRNQVVFATS